VTLEDDYGHH